MCVLCVVSQTGCRLQTLRGHTARVTCALSLHLSSEIDLLLTGSHDCSLRVRAGSHSGYVSWVSLGVRVLGLTRGTCWVSLGVRAGSHSGYVLGLIRVRVLGLTRGTCWVSLGVRVLGLTRGTCWVSLGVRVLGLSAGTHSGYTVEPLIKDTLLCITNTF